MDENTLFPREEKTDVLFNKILNEPWAYNKPVSYTHLLPGPTGISCLLAKLI